MEVKYNPGITVLLETPSLLLSCWFSFSIMHTLLSDKYLFFIKLRMWANFNGLY